MQRVKHGLTIILLLIGLALTSHAESDTAQYNRTGWRAQLTWSHPADRLRTTDTVTIDLRVVANADITITLPEDFSEDTAFRTVDRQESRAWDTKSKQYLYHVIWKLRPFLEGRYTIPPLDIRAIDADGRTSSIRTLKQSITVVSVLPEEASLSDIDKPIASSGISNTGPWIGLLAAGTLLMVLSLGGPAGKNRKVEEPLTVEEKLLKDCHAMVVGYALSNIPRDTCAKLLDRVNDHLRSLDKDKASRFDELRATLSKNSFGPHYQDGLNGNQLIEQLAAAVAGGHA